MLGSVVLDVAFGLIFFYFLLSTVCATIHEWIASVLSLRAKTLKEGITSILGGNLDLSSKLYEHPLIQGVAQGDGASQRAPSYLPARTFSTALVETLETQAELAEGAPRPDQGGSELLLRVRRVVLRIEDERARKALLRLLDSTKGDMGRLKQLVEQWFDDSMERVSGWYRRRAQRNILILAALLATAINGDTFHLCRGLYRDSLVRDAVVLSTKDFLRESKEKGQSSLNLAEVQAQVTKLNMPIGWRLDELPGFHPPPEGGTWTGRAIFWFWLVKIMGLFLTAVAVSLGAPFWFQLLNRIGNFRAAGERPERVAPPVEVPFPQGVPQPSPVPPTPEPPKAPVDLPG